MPIRALLCPPSPSRGVSLRETIQDLNEAAEDRYWEAYELAVQGQPYGAMYLFGYVAEMFLKSAGFLFDGASLNDQVGPRLGPAKVFGSSHFSHVHCESYHSILFWAEFLIEKRARAASGRAGPAPFPVPLASELRIRAMRIHQRWMVEMRYRSPRVPPLRGSSISIGDELLQLMEDVSWMRDNHSKFWR